MGGKNARNADRARNMKKCVIDWIDEEIFRLDHVEYKRRQDNFQNFSLLVRGHLDVAELQGREYRFVVRGIIRHVVETRSDGAKEIACGSRITDARVVYDECASVTETLCDVPDRHR